MAEKKVKVHVRAVKEEGFCRAGMRHPHGGHEVEVTAEQLAALKAEKNLVVTEVPAEKKEPAKTDEGGKDKGGKDRGGK